MLMKWARKSIPKISETEDIALNCGSVSVDGEIFNGTMTPDKLKTTKMSVKERAYLNNEVTKLCELHAKLGHDGDKIHDDVLAYMKEIGIFGMNIPEEYGGKGFSPAGIAEIVTFLASSGHPGMVVTVMVPNSLGPGELLQHYGTEEEKDNYLPKLATGEMLPCFALTGPRNGSDATNNVDVGKFINEDTIEVTLDKRYITLAPIADLIGLAIDVEGHGITLFLVEKDHPGLDTGKRHNPLNIEMYNGPIFGTIKLDVNKHTLGGKKNLGEGWKMLVECLSIGRAVSLPALAVGVSKMAVSTMAGYSIARKQFNVPLHKFEGIADKLANMIYHTTIIHEAQRHVNGELNAGEQPAILGAILKYQATERGRIVVNEAMDISGGIGIQMGPRNWLARSYMGMPVAITVEGANVLTRTLITYGQGLMRSHPHLRNIVVGATEDDSKLFHSNLRGLVKHMFRNGFKTLVTGDLPALFAYTADFTLLLGSSLKKKEILSGYMADFLSNVFFLQTLEGKEGLVYEYTRKRLMYDTKVLYKKIVAELPLFARMKLRPAGARVFFGVKDMTSKDVLKVVKALPDYAKELSEDIFVSEDTDNKVHQLIETLRGSDKYLKDVIEVDYK